MRLLETLRLGGSSIRLHPRTETAPRDDRPWWVIDRENLCNDAIAAYGGKQRIKELLNVKSENEQKERNNQ